MQDHPTARMPEVLPTAWLGSVANMFLIPLGMLCGAEVSASVSDTFNARVARAVIH